MSERDDEDRVDGAWDRELDSEGEVEHFVYPVETRKRNTAGNARKKAQDKIYPEPLPPGTAKGKDRMIQPPRIMDEGEIRRPGRSRIDLSR